MEKKARKVIVIMTDTQRWDMVGCYGNKDMKTPELDRMADEGCRFDRAYTCQPVCGPARSALFTGTFPHSNGGWGNTMPLGDNVKTIGQRLDLEGIPSAYIGKWHLDGGDYFGNGECPEGWDADYWYDMRNYLEELSEKDRYDSRFAEKNEDESLTESFTFGNRCSDRAVDYIEKHDKDDFLLVVSYDEPHHPFVCPKPFSDMYKGYEWPKSDNHYDDLSNKPEHHRAWAEDRLEENKDELKIENADYFGCNSYVDYEIGRVLEAARQHAPDALIIYTSDHGDFLYSHSLTGKGASMYDEITRIPFIVKWPDHIKPETTNQSPVSHIDIVPTIMDAFGLEQSKVLEGSSMVEMFEDNSKPTNDVAFIEFGRYEIDHDGFGGFQPIRCAVDGRYKLVINLLATDELYDMLEDAGEMNNLIDSPEHAEIRDALHDKILNWMNDTRDPFRGYYWERRPWRKDAREATWDYTGMTRQRMEDRRYECLQLDYATGLPIKEAVRPK